MIKENEGKIGEKVGVENGLVTFEDNLFFKMRDAFFVGIFRKKEVFISYFIKG